MRKIKVVSTFVLTFIITVISTTTLAFADYREFVRVPVLMYHSVTAADSATDAFAVTEARFREQLETIRSEGYTPVSLSELVNYVDYGANLPDSPMCITFDDGYLDNYTVAFPILKEYGYKATVFAIGSSVGKNTYKDTGIPMNPHFNYNQAREMNLSGLVSVQSHTYDMHQSAQHEGRENCRSNILRFDGESVIDYVRTLRNDFLKSRADTEGQIGAKLFALAYPGGRYDATSEAVLKSLGVRVTVSTTLGENYIRQGDAQSLYALNRYNMNDGVDPATLAQWLAH